MIVPKGKTMYLRGRRFVAGSEVPDSWIPEKKVAKETPEKPKKRDK